MQNHRIRFIDLQKESERKCQGSLGVIGVTTDPMYADFQIKSVWYFGLTLTKATSMDTFWLGEASPERVCDFAEEGGGEHLSKNDGDWALCSCTSATGWRLLIIILLMILAQDMQYCIWKEKYFYLRFLFVWWCRSHLTDWRKMSGKNQGKNDVRTSQHLHECRYEASEVCS